MTVHFQQKYASVVLELERLNKDLNEYLIGVQQFSQDVRIYLKLFLICLITLPVTLEKKKKKKNKRER